MFAFLICNYSAYFALGFRLILNNEGLIGTLKAISRIRTKYETKRELKKERKEKLFMNIIKKESH